MNDISKVEKIYRKRSLSCQKIREIYTFTNMLAQFRRKRDMKRKGRLPSIYFKQCVRKLHAG